MSDREGIIQLPEQFDFNHHTQFTQDYRACLNNPDVASLVLDFSRVVYVDSSAIGMINMLYKKASQEGKFLAIRNARGTAADLIRLANLHKLLPVQ